MKTIKTPEKQEQKIKLSLSVPERVNFPALLPPRSSLSGNSLSMALKKKIDFTPEEVKEFSLVFMTGGRYVYSPAKAKAREFEFEAFEILHIQQGIRMNDMAESIDAVNQELAERIMEMKV